MYFIPYKANEFLENSFFQVPKELFQLLILQKSKLKIRKNILQNLLENMMLEVPLAAVSYTLSPVLQEQD